MYKLCYPSRSLMWNMRWTWKECQAVFVFCVSALLRIRMRSSRWLCGRPGPFFAWGRAKSLCDRASFKCVPGTLHANLPSSGFVNFKAVDGLDFAVQCKGGENSLITWIPLCPDKKENCPVWLLLPDSWTNQRFTCAAYLRAHSTNKHKVLCLWVPCLSQGYKPTVRHAKVKDLQTLPSLPSIRSQLLWQANS